MDRWRRLVGGVRAHLARPGEPWYRRPDVWVVLGTALLPFGWVIALGRIGWAYLSVRRAGRGADGGRACHVERARRGTARPPLARPGLLAAESTPPPQPPGA
jgi:hypothetical protein